MLYPICGRTHKLFGVKKSRPMAGLLSSFGFGFRCSLKLCCLQRNAKHELMFHGITTSIIWVAALIAGGKIGFVLRLCLVQTTVLIMTLEIGIQGLKRPKLEFMTCAKVKQFYFEV
jgi:hypothetical protein